MFRTPDPLSIFGRVLEETSPLSLADKLVAKVKYTALFHLGIKKMMSYLRLASSIGPPSRCTTYSTKQLYMCQSQEKIEHYSVPYFDCITMFEAQHRISDKGRTDMCCVDTCQSSDLFAFS